MNRYQEVYMHYLKAKGLASSMACTKTSLHAALLMMSVVLVGCSEESIKDPRLQPPNVEVFTVKSADSEGRSYTGIVEARVLSNLGFRVGGKIVERAVNIGDRIKKGQLLMRLDSEDLRLAAAAQQAHVEASRARYVQAKADEARFALLVKSRAVSSLEYDQTKAALDSTEAQLRAAQAQANVTDNSSEYASLLADSDGVVVKAMSEPGQVVVAGQTVVQLAHDGPREAVINLPEGVRPASGTVAVAKLYGQEGISKAELRQFSNAADPVSRTFEARFVLWGEAAAAPLGSTITITLNTGTAASKQLMTVPLGAIYDNGSGPGVWIVGDNSKVRLRPVEIRSLGKEEATVTSGLQAGDKIVALGAHLLHEEQTIKATPGEGNFDARL